VESGLGTATIERVRADERLARSRAATDAAEAAQRELSALLRTNRAEMTFLLSAQAAVAEGAEGGLDRSAQLLALAGREVERLRGEAGAAEDVRAALADATAALYKARSEAEMARKGESDAKAALAADKAAGKGGKARAAVTDEEVANLVGAARAVEMGGELDEGGEGAGAGAGAVDPFAFRASVGGRSAGGPRVRSAAEAVEEAANAGAEGEEDEEAEEDDDYEDYEAAAGRKRKRGSVAKGASLPGGRKRAASKAAAAAEEGGEEEATSKPRKAKAAADVCKCSGTHAKGVKSCKNCACTKAGRKCGEGCKCGDACGNPAGGMANKGGPAGLADAAAPSATESKEAEADLVPTPVPVSEVAAIFLAAPALPPAPPPIAPVFSAGVSGPSARPSLGGTKARLGLGATLGAGGPPVRASLGGSSAQALRATAMAGGKPSTAVQPLPPTWVGAGVKRPALGARPGNVGEPAPGSKPSSFLSTSSNLGGHADKKARLGSAEGGSAPLAGRPSAASVLGRPSLAGILPGAGGGPR